MSCSSEEYYTDSEEDYNVSGSYHDEDDDDFVDDGYSISDEIFEGVDVVHFVYENDYEKLQLFFDNGGSTSCITRTGRTPIFFLNSKSGNIHPCGNLLIQKGANPNHTDYDGMTPLHSAIINDDQESIIFLLDNGADPEIKFPNGTSTYEHPNGKQIHIYLDRTLDTKGALDD